MGASVDVPVGDRGLPWYAVGAAVKIPGVIAVNLAGEIVVEVAIASATGLHGVALHLVEFHGSPWNVRRNPWMIRGCRCSVRGCA